MIDYDEFARTKIDSYNNFCKSAKIINHSTGEFVSLGDFDSFMSQRFYYTRDKFNLLHKLEIRKGDVTPIFITTTVPSSYHHNYDVNGAYDALISFRRDLYRNFKDSLNRFVKVSQINVIEPHKSMMPHQHSVYYVPTSKVNLFLKHYFRTLKFHKFNKKGQDFKILDSSFHSILYLMKYIEKTMKMEDKTIIGWYKKHKIRQFQTSNIKDFNKEIWKIMIKEKDYFFLNGYDILKAYDKITTKEIKDDEKQNIEDDTHTIYYYKAKPKSKATNVQNENLPYFFVKKKTDTTAGRERIEKELFLMESCDINEGVFAKFIDDRVLVSSKKFFCHRYQKFELLFS